MEFCRICFTNNTNVEVLGESQEKDFLENLFTKEGVNKHLDGCFLVCYECKALLKKSCNFIQKVLKAQQAFIILQDQKSENADIWASFKNNLELNSMLSYHRVEINLFLKEEQNLLHEDEIDSKEFLNGLIKVEYPDEFDELDNAIDDADEDNLLFNLDKSIEEGKPQSYNKRKSGRIANYKNKNNKPSQFTIETSIKDELNLVNKKKIKKSKYSDTHKNVLAIINTEREDSKPELYPKVIKRVKVNKAIKKVKDEDREFIPKTELSSSDSESSCDNYDDNGRKLKNAPRIYPRQCDHCDCEIRDGKSHYLHYLSHHSHDMYPYLTKQQDKQFICQHCGSRKRNNFMLKQHEATHGEKNVTCADCGKSFHNVIQLRKHKNAVHGVRKFICDYCKKPFQSGSDLKRHIRIHTGEKPYKCNICGISYATYGNLTIHMRKSCLDKDGNPVFTNRRQRKQTSLRETDDDDYDIPLKARKKKAKDQEKCNEDTTSNISEALDFDTFKN